MSFSSHALYPLPFCICSAVTLGPSLYSQVKGSRSLYKFLQPVANAYANLSGYRKVGLKYDDILIEETPIVQKAISRLSERQSYDRAFRLRTAHMCSIAHAPLPKNLWLPKEADERYLKPFVEELEAEAAERALWDNVTVDNKKAH